MLGFLVGGVVAIASVISLLGIAPRRSFGSMFVGAAIVLTSYVALLFAPYLALQMAKGNSERSTQNIVALLVCVAAAAPAIRVTISFI
jgi:hypothetical protein